MATYLMNPYTGSVDTLENWQDDFDACTEDEREMNGWPENFEDADLVEVVPNSENDPDYDPAYSDWRPAV